MPRRDVHKARMDNYRANALAWLRQVIEETGRSASELAAMVDVSPSTFTRPLNNPDFKYAPKFDTLRRVAAATGIPLSEGLTNDQGVTPVQLVGVRELPVRGKVAAGVWLELDTLPQEPLGTAPMVESQRYQGVPQWAELLQGPSMDKHYIDGEFLHVVDAIALGYRALPGDHVIVERKSEQEGRIERTCKMVDYIDGRKVVRGDSHDPKWNRPLALDELGEGSTVEIVGLVIGSYRARSR